MIRLLTVVLFSILALPSYSQEGDYYLSHFSPPVLKSDHQVFDLAQDENGIFYMAHKSGIFIFNGESWENVPFSTSVFAVEKVGDELYTAGPDGFSHFSRNESYEWEFQPLHEHNLVKDIIRMDATDSTLFGISTTNLYTYNLRNGEAKVFSASESHEFVNLFEFRNQMHVLDAEGHTYRIEGRQLRRVKEAIAEKDLVFVARHPDDDAYLAADLDNKLYIYKDRLHEILADILDKKDRQYLEESEVTSGVWVNDSLVAVSTLKGGVIFINPFLKGKRKVQNVVNYQNDLPDNEVLALELDNRGGLWVVHEKGFTRIATAYPFRRYDHFPGLEGKLLSAFSHNGVLYVGSSQGLFYLKETPVFEREKERYTTWVTEEKKTKRKGFFNRIFGKKKTTTTKPREVIRTTKRFHSIQHEYQKLQPITSKVFHLTEINGELFAGGLDGIFRINGNQLEQITDLPVKYFHYSQWRDRIYAVTYDGDVFSMKPEKTRSDAREIYSDVTEPIHYIFENARGELFFTGIHTLYVSALHEKSFRSIPFENPFYEETFGIIRDDSVFLVNESGVYSVNTKEEATQRLADIENPERILRGAGDQVWILEPAGWKAPGKHIGDNTFRHLLTLDRISFVAENDRQGLWVITENNIDDNALYQLLPREPKEWYKPSPLFLEEIRTPGGTLSPHGEVKIEQEESFISFVFRQPDFSGLMNTEYMYELSGEMEETSNWDAGNNMVKFTYLPAGKYHLRLRARNELGQVSEVSDVSFQVLAPYWKRTWFYALEFAIITLMLLISMKMKAMGYKYRLISRLLALLTLITIIELIQALAESKFETETSPVFGFIIQVLMAIMILPVEEILRKYIFKEKHVKVFDIFTLREKKPNPDLVDQSAMAGDEL